MESIFKPGDLLLYFNNKVAYIVLLDEISENYFTVVTHEDSTYQYGFMIKIRNLTSKYFIKLDSHFSLTRGHWERIVDVKEELLSFKNDFRESSNESYL